MGNLPPFLQEYKEIQKLMGAEEPEFQMLVEECERLLDNLFIDSADVDGISRFEKIVGILPAVDDTLELRRTRLFARWNDIVPYTISVLKKKISSIQGNKNIEVSVADYVISIITNMEQRGQVDELMILLKEMIPCNLKIISQNNIVTQNNDVFVLRGGIVTTETFYVISNVN